MRIVVMPPFDMEFFGGKNRLELDARTVIGLVNKMDEVGPGFADLADVRAAIAVDGVVQADWSASIAGAEEIIVMQRVAGG